jgi:hypothetical protein
MIMGDLTPEATQKELLAANKGSTKNPFVSKTVIANVLAGVLAVLGIAINSPAVPPQYIAIGTGVVMPVLNIILRFLTDKPLDLSAPITNPK